MYSINKIASDEHAIQRPSRYHYTPSSSEADESDYNGTGADVDNDVDKAVSSSSSDDEMEFGSLRRLSLRRPKERQVEDGEAHPEDSMSLAQLRDQVKKENEENKAASARSHYHKKRQQSRTSGAIIATKKETQQAEQSGRRLRQYGYGYAIGERTSPRNRADKKYVKQGSESSDSESDEQNRDSEVFEDDFKVYTLHEQVGAPPSLYEEHEPEDPRDHLCDLIWPNPESELFAFLRRYLYHHRVYKDLARKDYNVWGKRASLRSRYLRLNEGRGWPANQTQSAVWDLCDKWSMKKAKRRRHTRTQFFLNKGGV
jgi:hypothetical protein